MIDDPIYLGTKKIETIYICQLVWFRGVFLLFALSCLYVFALSFVDGTVPLATNYPSPGYISTESRRVTPRRYSSLESW